MRAGPPASRPSWTSVRISIPPNWHTVKSAAWALILLGAALRAIEYFANRTYWLDEATLFAVIRRGWSLPASHDQISNQMVAPLFLWAERGLVALFGESRYVTRAVPFAASLAALPLMHRLCRHVLGPRAGLLALALFTLSDELIYYSAELKPYGVDVAVALWLMERALRPDSGRRLLILALIGTIAIWMSLPACFVLAAIGVTAFRQSLAGRSASELRGLAAVGLLLLLSFAAMYVCARGLLRDARSMWVFWNFAFPPALWSDLLWIPRRLLFLFMSPLDFHGPLDPRISALPAAVCALCGLFWLVRYRTAHSAILFLPLVLALLAAALRLYPFHGRCILFLVPSLHVAIAAGAAVLCRRRTDRARYLIAFLLLANTCLIDARHLLEPRNRSGLNPHGDRRPDRLSPDIFGQLRLPDR
jgi:uncharacterized membrane protein